MKTEYLVNGSAIEFPTDWDAENIEYMVQDAAEHFHENHDGAECSWPLAFELYIDDDSMGTFKVEREFSPEFSVEQIDI